MLRECRCRASRHPPAPCGSRRETALLVLLQPIGIVKTRADFCDRVADRFLVGGERKIHRSQSYGVAALGDAVAHQRGDLVGGKAGLAQNFGAVLVQTRRQPGRLGRRLRPGGGYLHVADRRLRSDDRPRKKSGRHQMRILQHALEIVHRHHRHVGLVKQLGPLGGGARFEDAGQFGIDHVDIDGASGEGREFRDCCADRRGRWP